MAHNLPNLVKPTHYDIKLYNFDLEKFTFSGDVSISLEELESLENKIVLNSYELEIKEATITAVETKTETTLKAQNIAYDEAGRNATLEFGQSIKHDNRKSILSLKFNGILNNTMSGFYRSAYTDANGEKKYMFSSQCEACDARRIIPCFDEPALKATFASTLIIPSELTALSNMPVKSEKPYADGSKKGKGTAGYDLKRVEFETTPVMSTYLLAYAIGEFEYIEAFTEKVRYHGKRIPVRVYTTKGLIKQGQFGLENAVKIVDHFSKVFDIDYMLPKCDLLAVHEFSHGVMENWGLITYRSTALLFDEELSDSKYKIRVAYVVAHELAHQWFGNLVTMEWWNSLWLNEGFATWVGWLAVDHLYPEWDVWSKFTSESLQSALTMDSLKGSHAIEVEVNDALEIDQIFDAISYMKGSSCIRMLSNHLGVETFLKGVSNYLKKHAYGNATTEDLWNALSDASGVRVRDNMALWIQEVGYPVLTVAEETNGIGIEQSRFISTGDATEADQKLWWVPLGLKTEKSTTHQQTSNTLEKQKHIDIRGLDLAFYKLNDSASGVYRVNYPPSRLETLGKQIASGHPLLNASDRISLVADAAALAISGDGSTTGFLSLAENFKKETNFFVWEELLKRLGQLQSAWYEQPEKVVNALRAFSMILVSEKVVEVGWEAKEGEGYLTSQLRPLLLKEAHFARIPGIKEEAKRRFQEWRGGNHAALPPYLRRVVFGIVLGEDPSLEDYNAILETHKTSESADGKEIALGAIGDVKPDALIKRTIDFILSGDIAAQDIHSPSNALAGNTKTRDLWWETMKDNWDLLYKRYSVNMVVLNRLITLSLGKFASKQKAEDISSFFKDKDVKGFDRGLNQSLDLVNGFARWVERDAPVVEKWLLAKGYMK